MAGDHKCPVCSSTFTRPQHVARHMRSHTGDRPYKCTHCGDQFARSDLLSRHVNKCHASEKPPTTTQPSRRKGHAQPGSASAGGVRGPAPSLIPPPGTRKICDPCAHSRTPAQCDSGIPCGKCLQRNTKCTYVKASEASRREPGRAPASSVPLARPHTHDLFAPPPTVPSMGPRPGPSESLFPSQAAFNFTVPLYPQSLDPRSATSAAASFAPGPFDTATATEPVEYPPALTPGFLQMLRQTLYQPQSSHSAAFTDQALAMPPHMGAYPDGRKTGLDAFLGGSYGAGPGASDFLYNHAAASADMLAQQQQQQQQDIQQQQQQQQQQTHTNVQTYGFDPANVFAYDEHAQPRLVGSDYAYAPQQGQPQFPAGMLPSLRGPGIAEPPQPGLLPPREGGFSSAFGLMSLDDPAVAAEMSKGASFFAPGALPDKKDGLAHPNANNPMMMPMPLGASTPGRDANIAELRDFWKAFMRSPGEKTPGTGLVSSILNGSGGGGHPNPNDADRPAMRRSLSKMASLPDIKTPEGARYAGGGGGREDLRSYEMAVLARQAPSLTLAPRQRAREVAQQHAQHPHAQHHAQHPHAHAQHLSPHPSPPPHPSPAASVSTTTSASSGVGPGQGQPAPAKRRERPSFKRLASQTLGPFEAKSAKVSHDGAGAGAIAQYESDGAVHAQTLAHNHAHAHSNFAHAHAPGQSHHVRSPSGEYPPAHRDEQGRATHRRLSAPTASAPRPAFVQ